MAKGRLASGRYGKTPYYQINRAEIRGSGMSFLGTVLLSREELINDVRLPAGSLIYFEFPEDIYGRDGLLPPWMLAWRDDPRSFSNTILDMRRTEVPVFDMEIKPYSLGRGGAITWPHPEDNIIRTAPLELDPFVRKEVIVSSIPSTLRA